MTFTVDAGGQPLIERTKMLPIWPSRWLHQILVEIQLRQRDLTKSHHIDYFNGCKLPNPLLRSFTNGLCLRHRHLRIAYGNRDGGNKDGCDGVRSVA